MFNPINTELPPRYPPTLSPDDSVGAAAGLFTHLGITALPVLQEGEIVGGVSIFDLLGHGVSHSTPMKDVMNDHFKIIRGHRFEELLNDQHSLYVICNEQGHYQDFMSREQMRNCIIELLGEKLRELEAVIELANDSIMGINSQGNVTIFNRAAERLAGMTKEDVLGKSLRSLSMHKGLLRVASIGEPDNFKFLVGERIFISNRFPLKENSEVKGAVSIIKDVTFYEELVQVRQKNVELTSILNSSVDGISVLNEENEIVVNNMAFGEMIATDLGDSFLEFLKRFADRTRQNNHPHSKLYPCNGKEFLITSFLITGNAIGDVALNIRDLSEINQLRFEIQKYEQELSNIRDKNIEQVQGIIAHSKEMSAVIEKALRIAPYNSTVLLTGESGTGKEVIAKLIHSRYKKERPFISVNCGAIPEHLLESELFGYEPGAFTGALQKGKPGLFETANGGTIFLDEVGELPLKLQVKLLRVLQEKTVTRIGGVKEKKLDVRIISATNQNLMEKVVMGEYRQDLYYRLNVVPILLPPLRARKGDIPELIRHFRAEFHQKHNIDKEFGPKALRILLNHDYPGNVRELENLVERLLLVTDGSVVTETDVIDNLSSFRPAHDDQITVSSVMPLREARAELERKLITKALEQYPSTHKAALVLGMSQSSVVRKMQSLGLSSY